MNTHYDNDTEVSPTDDPSKFTANISNNWSVGDAPNGGYLMVLAISAARKVSPFHDPLSMTAYYCNKAVQSSIVEIEVKTLNVTKSSATLSVSFVQNGILRSHYLGTFGLLTKQTGMNYNHTMTTAPELPHPDDCVDCTGKIRHIFGPQLNLAQRVQFRSPKDDPFVLGAIKKEETTIASLACWARFDAGERLPGLRSMALFCDVIPPPVLNMLPFTWVPTLEYTVHFWQRADCSKRGLPAPQTVETVAVSTAGTYWLRCAFSTPIVVNGLLYTDGQLWSEDGTQLLATSRQLAKVLPPRAAPAAV